MIDDLRNADRLPPRSRKGSSAKRHSGSADGGDVITAGVAVIAAVNLAAVRIRHVHAADDEILRFR